MMIWRDNRRIRPLFLRDLQTTSRLAKNPDQNALQAQFRGSSQPPDRWAKPDLLPRLSDHTENR